MVQRKTGNCFGLLTPTDFIYCMNECSDTWRKLNNAQHVVSQQTSFTQLYYSDRRRNKVWNQAITLKLPNALCPPLTFVVILSTYICTYIILYIFCLHDESA